MASTQEFCSYFNHKASSFYSNTHMNTLLYLIHISFLNHFHMAVRWDVKWCPVSRIKSPLARKRPFHWIPMKRKLVRAAMGTSKFQNWSHLKNSRQRYMAEILPIRRKTLSNCIFATLLLTPLRKRAWPFIWTNLNFIQQSMLCVKFG